MKPVRTAFFCLPIALAGCASLDPTVALDSATRAAGASVGEAIGDAMVRQYSPQATQYYTTYLTQMAFNSQGFSVSSATRGYEPGEFTEWSVVTTSRDDSENRMRRAFLERTDSGDEWWQVIYDDAETEDVIIMEALFSDDREQMLRLRAQFPDDEGPQEVPVEEGTYQSPRVLTQESIDGATEGQETLTVPAGTFNTTRVSFGSGPSEETWWLSDDVPGGVVQHRVAASGSEADIDDDDLPEGSYTMQLQAYGEGAESRFGL